MPLPKDVLVGVEGLLYSHSFQRMVAGGPYDNNNRQVLHVQCMSYWAPMCIGPYSQANVIFNSVVFVAGQIPIDPSCMEVWKASIAKSLILCMRHVARILGVYTSKLQDVLACIIYAPHHIFNPYISNAEDLLALGRKILHVNCYDKIEDSNVKISFNRDIHSIYPDNMDSSTDSMDGDGDSAPPSYPIIVIPVITLPKNAPLEVEYFGMKSGTSITLIFWESRETIQPNKNEFVDKSANNGLMFGMSESSQTWPFWLKSRSILPSNTINSSEVGDDCHDEASFTFEIDISVDVCNTLRYCDFCIISGFLEFRMVDGQAASDEGVSPCTAAYLGMEISNRLTSLFNMAKLSIAQHLRYLRLFYSIDRLPPDRISLVRQAISCSFTRHCNDMSLPIVLIPMPLLNNFTGFLKVQYLGIDGLQLQSELWIHGT